MRRFHVYDSRTRETRVFAPITPPRVGMYVCGMTPYSAAHVGHARTMVFFDVVARALRRWGYRPFYVQNVTNLDDKVIARAADSGDDPLALADRQFRDYLASMERLGVRSVNLYPYATDYVPEILAQVRVLIEKGFAYRSDDGSVYFEVAKFPTYGSLSGQRREELRPGARLELDPRKRAPEDFVIWKAATPGEPSWESPWGPGRPGWHIEDTAMTGRLLGDRYDLHGGGVDLIFPHHEAEVALAESATGVAPLANYWMHGGLLLLEGTKMSKSLGNVAVLDAVLDEYGPMPLRLYYLNVSYRSPLEFDPARSLVEAREAYDRLAQPAQRIAELLERGGTDREGEEISEGVEAEADDLVERLDTLLADDFATREAIAALYGWGRRVGELGSLARYSGASLESLYGPYEWAEEVLGLFVRDASRTGGAWSEIVPVLLEARARARARGDFAEADRIRDALAARGIRVQDGADGTRWEFDTSG